MAVSLLLLACFVNGTTDLSENRNSRAEFALRILLVGLSG